MEIDREGGLVILEDALDLLLVSMVLQRCWLERHRPLVETVSCIIGDLSCTDEVSSLNDIGQRIAWVDHL